MKARESKLEATQLTARELQEKSYFDSIISRGPDFEGVTGIKRDEYKFHHAMQHPSHGSIVFDGEDWGDSCPSHHRRTIHNGLLGFISDYFNTAGEHLYGYAVHTLIIRNMQLSDYYNRDLPDQMPDGTEYIANLIEKNPKIKTIDLSNTLLGDKEADKLIKALEKNNRLTTLELHGNKISSDRLYLIQKKLQLNKLSQRRVSVTGFSIVGSSPQAPVIAPEEIAISVVAPSI